MFTMIGITGEGHQLLGQASGVEEAIEILGSRESLERHAVVAGLVRVEMWRRGRGGPKGAWFVVDAVATAELAERLGLATGRDRRWGGQQEQRGRRGAG